MFNFLIFPVTVPTEIARFIFFFFSEKFKGPDLFSDIFQEEAEPLEFSPESSLSIKKRAEEEEGEEGEGEEGVEEGEGEEEAEVFLEMEIPVAIDGRRIEDVVFGIGDFEELENEGFEFFNFFGDF